MSITLLAVSQVGSQTTSHLREIDERQDLVMHNKSPVLSQNISATLKAVYSINWKGEETRQMSQMLLSYYHEWLHERGDERVSDGEKTSELWETWSEWDGGEESRKTDKMSYRPRERGSFHTWRQPSDLGRKDTETSSAVKGDRPKEM